MKLSTWAKKQGISYRTAWRWFTEGKLPVPAEQTATGTILIRETSIAEGVAIYARVSSSAQKSDLDRQVRKLVMFANAQKWVVMETVIEIGSALNDHRPKLKKLLLNANIQVIVVEHRDRLMRFGLEYVESLLAAQGRKLVIVDPIGTKDDLVQEMEEVLTSFCTRLYGRRLAKSRARKMIACMQSQYPFS